MSQLNFKHLRYFWMVAKTGSMAKAATQLHLTPQSISGQLSAFETQLGAKLLQRAGRNLELTDVGQRILSYADEIFGLGDELFAALREQTTKRSLPLRVGIADSVPKTVVYRLLEPALRAADKGDLAGRTEALRLVCREGRLANLLSELAVHRLDLIIADRAMPANIHVRGFSHLLGESTMSVFATKAIAKRLRGVFPANLQGVDFLLPGEDFAIRSKLSQWFEQHHLLPHIRGEFDDTALMKAFGQAGVGLFVAPSASAKQICAQYQVQVVGKIDAVRLQIYAITTERRITHPAILAIRETARLDVFADLAR
jgi:LysR family transcriptional regulator, transcriptional activator of nhaA